MDDTTTFKMKTFYRKHMCGSVFNNKTTNSKWMAKKVAKKLLTTKRVTLDDIVNGIRRAYSIRVTAS